MLPGSDFLENFSISSIYVQPNLKVNSYVDKNWNMSKFKNKIVKKYYEAKIWGRFKTNS